MQARFGIYAAHDGRQMFVIEANWQFGIDGVDTFVLNTRAGLHVLVRTRNFSPFVNEVSHENCRLRSLR